MAEIIWKIPVASTSFLQEVNFSKLSGRTCSLEYTYESEEDCAVILEAVIFEGIESFKCTYFMACSMEMIKAYDNIIDVGESEWLAEVIQNLLSSKSDSTNLKHLRIYLDDGPCYEFICRDFKIVTEKQ